MRSLLGLTLECGRSAAAVLRGIALAIGPQRVARLRVFHPQPAEVTVMTIRTTVRLSLAAFFVLALAGCGDSASLPEEAAQGRKPTIPEPTETLIPTLKIAKAVGWPEGAEPTPAAELKVDAFAKSLDHPRWLYRLPNGDVLVAETNTPEQEGGSKGIKGLIFE